jgi:nuclear transport factor 2 (NTF2) superfamily protein/metal-dependent hydrolase (beta-lactamase superfamily II)
VKNRATRDRLPWPSRGLPRGAAVDPIALEPVDEIVVTTLVDNVFDALLPGDKRVRRASFGVGQVQAPQFESGATAAGLIAEHGFSVLVSVRRGAVTTRLLFDTGLSPDAMVINAGRLGMDPSDVQAVILSHGHFDHAGGLAGLAGRRGARSLPMVVHPMIWTRRRQAVPGREPMELPTLSRRALDGEGFTVIERREPSLLVDGSVLITGEVDRTAPAGARSTRWRRPCPAPGSRAAAARPSGSPRRPPRSRTLSCPRTGGRQPSTRGTVLPFGTTEGMNTMAQRPPVPPFTPETAAQKIRAAEDAWNSRDPERVALAYTPGSRWRNRSQFIDGRAEIVEFLTGKWAREHEYRLIKELWACDGDRIAVRFCYEWHDDAGQWYRAYGNENWKFDADGSMAERHASINDVPIADADRKFHWDRSGPRPADHPGLSELGL